MLNLLHEGTETLRVTLEVDEKGNGQWQPLSEVEVPAKQLVWQEFTAKEQGAWVRLKVDKPATALTAFFHYRNEDLRNESSAEMFSGLARPGDQSIQGGLIHARGFDFKTLRYLARHTGGDIGCYDLNGDLVMEPSQDAEGAAWVAEKVAIPQNVLSFDAASVVYEDEKGRWRLPRGSAAFDQASSLGDERIDREVCTERDLFNAAGTFFELPAENAGGVAKIRPVTTHNCRIKDYASFRGLLVLSGIRADAKGEHIIRSADGKAALWAGAVDDLWQMGKPRGFGGPWKDTAVKANEPSDPYLMTGYDRKTLTVSHTANKEVHVRIEVDLTGTGLWCSFAELEVPSKGKVEYEFPKAFSAYWLRLVSNQDCSATGQLVYE